MKKFILLFSIVFFIICYSVSAKVHTTGDAGSTSYIKFQARLKAGIGQSFLALPIDFNKILSDGSATINGVKNDFLKTNWGPYGGLNLDFYFRPNLGFGADFDYFNNNLKFITPSILSDYIATNQNTSLTESNRKNQSFIFVGIGPSFKLFTNEHWDVDLNLRGGLSMQNMGSLMIKVNGVNEDLNKTRDTVLNFNYSKTVNVFGAKIGLYTNYWINSHVGITFGVDFIHSFVSTSKINGDAEYVCEYKDPQNYLNQDGSFNARQYFNGYNHLDTYLANKMNVNHISASVGIVFKIDPERK